MRKCNFINLTADNICFTRAEKINNISYDQNECLK